MNTHCTLDCYSEAMHNEQLHKPYGYELVLDLHECNPDTFTRSNIDTYFTELCKVLEMQKCVVHFWDDLDLPLEEHETLPHLKGTSAVCFISTSSIVIHTLDILKAAYINIFSCKSLDEKVAQEFSERWFNGSAKNASFLGRG